MISVITCCRHPLPQSIQEKNIARTVGVPYEYLPIDGSNHASNAALLNYGISLAKGDIVVFMADDAYSMKYNWGTVLEQKFADPHVACVGVAGTQYLFPNTPSLTAPGRPFIKGRIVYHLQNGDFFAVVYSPENGDFDVVACDGVFMAVRAELLAKAWFDQDTFDGEHLADIDLCMQLNTFGKIIVTTDIVIKKRSQIQFDKVWHEYSRRFLEKWSFRLPAYCSTTAPDPQHILHSQCVDLRGKAPMETIC